MRDLPDIYQIMTIPENGHEGTEGALTARRRAIAAREAQNGAAPYAALAAEFLALIGAEQGVALLARLVAAIRAGRFDEPGPERAQLEILLWRFASLRAAENDPDFMI
jgi:hypothetical protein